MSPTLINFDEETKMLLKLKSAETGLSVSELVRQFVLKALTKQNKKQNPLIKVKGIIKKEDLKNVENLNLSQIPSNIDNLIYGENNS